MANDALPIRLSAIMRAYLQDLADVGYGTTPTAVARRFIENAVTHALEMKVIESRKASDFKADTSDQE